MNKKQTAIIVDIDGTIAQKNPDRDICDCSKVHMDLPIIPVIEVIKRIASVESYEIGEAPYCFFVSGRENSCSYETMQWIQRNVCYNNDINYHLLMRKTGDYRPDTVIKSEIYEEHIKDKYNVIAVFDDRPCVLRMWRKLGLFTFNVQQGENDF